MKAKEAAQKRRDNEAVEMERLSNVLPFTREVVEKLDKGSIIRLAIAYIKIKHAIQRGRSLLLSVTHHPVLIH